MPTQSKKRILFIITQSEYGGAQRFLHTLLLNIDREKYDITVAFGQKTGKDFLEKELRKIGVAVKRLKHLRRNPHPYHDVAALFEIRSLIKKRGIQTVFLQSSKAGFVGSLATVFPLRLKDVKVIQRNGGWAFNDPRPTWQRWGIIGMERLAASWKDIIVQDNQFGTNEAERLGITPREKLVTIHNGIDPHKVTYLTKQEAREALITHMNNPRLFDRATVIGMQANFYPTKDVLTFLKAINELRDNDIRCIIIGDGAQRAILQRYIEQHNLTDMVSLTGALPDAAQYFTAFDIFALTSVKEGCPWALLEAMGARLPIVATSVGSIPEMIDHGKSGFIVAPRDHHDIAKHLQKLIDDEQIREKMGIEAHQKLLFTFAPDRMAREIEALLN